jgi:hypothetical protein
MDFKIEIYNQYNLEENKKYNLCPICAPQRSVKNQKKRCLMSDWETGIGTCQHCKQVIQLHKYRGINNVFCFTNPIKKSAKPEGSFHTIEFLELLSFKCEEVNNLSKYLEHFFTRKQIFNAELKYLLFSTNDFYRNSTCFPYINEKEQITGIKVMPYDDKGNRIKNKDGNGIVNWIHSIKKIENWNNNFCLFGLHQIKERSEKSVHIVESEKTAFIMSIVKPEFIWLASGGLTMLNKIKLEPLRHLKIILHPDKGKSFIIWSDYANQWSDLDIIVSRITENNPYIQDKGDLADYYLLNANKKKLEHFKTIQINSNHFIDT